MGIARDYPPINETGFLAYARSLPASQFFDAIASAQPETGIFGYRRTENRVRHYDQLPRYLEGFVVGGDAACVLNPVYAQGMSAALLGSQALAECLQQQREHGHLTGLARAFQSQLVQAVAAPWRLATHADQRWSDTEVLNGPVLMPDSNVGFKLDSVRAYEVVV